LTDTILSGGNFPTSATLYRNILYVLNAGDDPNITGFKLTIGGKLDPIAGSTRQLPILPKDEDPESAFAQVGFDPHGDFLVVTDKGYSKILVYTVDEYGLPGEKAVISDSTEPVPFGFVFDPRSGNLLVVAASGAVSSYEISPDGMLISLDSIPNGQKAACWIARNSRGSVYTANTGSDTISLYKFNSRNGSLALPDAATATTTGKAPIDMATAVTFYGSFLYALNSLDGTIGMYRIKADGSLKDLGSIEGLPTTFAQGIAAR
jgi:6-phosphogluconolactonase (cycloisomerase 2 family)